MYKGSIIKLCKLYYYLNSQPIPQPNLHLKGKLKGYPTLKIDFDSIAYRLVYLVNDKPALRRVESISFGEHDSAYDRVLERLNK